MQVHHILSTRTPTQAPSHSMRGVAAPCTGLAKQFAQPGSGRVGATPWRSSQFDGRDYGYSMGGGPA